MNISANATNSFAQAKNFSTEWIDERPKVSNLVNIKTQKLADGPLVQTEFIDKIKKEKKTDAISIQTMKDIVIHKKNVIKHIKEEITVPKAINDNSLPTKAEHLSVYVDQKWLGNKQELEDQNIKDAPTFAKLKQPNNTATSDKISILNDDSLNLQVAHHVGRSVNHIHNGAIREAILAASASSSD